MAIKDWIFLVLGLAGTFFFGYTVGRESVFSNLMDILNGFMDEEKDESHKNKDEFNA